jgi:molybdopterin-guanine dinucleotide biosynthesis protein A
VGGGSEEARPPGRGSMSGHPNTPPAGSAAGGGPVGVVLAGGASRRLGRDKATLVVGGETLAARTAARLAAAGVAEVVVADAGRRLVAGLPSLADGPGAGPAAGILGAAAARPGQALLVLACDLPDVPASLLAHLTRIAGADWVVPAGPAGLEPLCALYRPRALEALAARVAAGRFALHPLAADPGLAVHVLGPDALAAWGDPERTFANLNRPEDLERFLATVNS